MMNESSMSSQYYKRFPSVSLFVVFLPAVSVCRLCTDSYSAIVNIAEREIFDFVSKILLRKFLRDLRRTKLPPQIDFF